ncbi:MAG: hypothetical protein KDA83_03150 [Planctomycetales bacterium]|nr:hypothetical protein [Planctomycetales bacterium]
MIKEVLKHMDYQFWAEGGLVLFLAAFAIATTQALLQRRKEVSVVSRLPLED